MIDTIIRAAVGMALLAYVIWCYFAEEVFPGEATQKKQDGRQENEPHGCKEHVN